MVTAPARVTEKRRVREINRRLLDEYGLAPERSREHPTDSLIATILSQHTADRNSGAAFARLKERYRSWQEIARAPQSDLADTIRVAGLANIKAARIQSVLRTLQRDLGTMDLNLLRSMPQEEAQAILRSLPGVGPKTAACVLLFSCRLPALPVDTHVHRVAGRLGLIGPKISAEVAHVELAQLVPPDDVYNFHVNFIRHGRAVCRARQPLCEICPLQSCCAYWLGVRRQDGKRRGHGA